MITVESMPESAQKSYHFTNKARKIAMMISWVLAPLLFLICLFTAGDVSFGERIGASILLLLLYGCLPSGIVHILPFGKNILKRFFLLGILPAIFVVVLGSWLIGWVFAIADTILFIMKKPLVYPFEMHRFLSTEKAQTEMMHDMTQGVQNAQESEAAMANLQKLKEMFEQGVITEEEFKGKKSALLSKI